MSDNMLKPCPFCGGAAVFVEIPYRGTGASGMEYPDWRVECTGCHVATPQERGEAWKAGKGTWSLASEAQKALARRWNTRTEVER